MMSLKITMKSSKLSWGHEMNERIRNLMIEAGKTIPGDKQIDADFCEKFAELIVRECIDVVGDVLPDIVCESKGGIHPVWHLKKHFGV